MQQFLRHREESVAQRVRQMGDDFLQARCRRMRACAESSELDLQVKKGTLLGKKTNAATLNLKGNSK